jgi:hypothetical protein
MGKFENLFSGGTTTPYNSNTAGRFSGMFDSDNYKATIGRIEIEKKQRKLEEQLLAAQEQEKKYLEEFQKTQGGWRGALNRFFGKGQEMPTLVNETPEYQQMKEESKPPTFKESMGKVWQGTQKLVAGGLTKTYEDTVLQKDKDKEIQRRIEQNNQLVRTTVERKKQNPQKADFYDKFIQDRIKENQDLASQAGGEIAKKTNLQLVGQSLETALDVTNIILPIESLFKTGAIFITEAGIKLTSREVGKILAKKGIQATGEQATKALADMGITAVKESVKKIILKSMASGAGYGGTYGLAYGIEEKNPTVKSVAKSTGIGAAGGALLAGLLSGAQGIFGKLTAKRAVNKSINIIENEMGKLDPEEATIIKEGMQAGLTKNEIVAGLKQSRKELESVFGKELPVEKEIEKSVVQIIDKKTGEKSFQTIAVGELENFKNLIDNTKTGIAGKEIEGKTYHLTAKNPEQMTEQGFKYTGEAKIKEMPKVSGIPKERVEVPQSQLPVGGGKVKTSKLESRIKSNLENASEEVKNLSTYNEMNNKKIIAKSVEYVEKNPEEALQVLEGNKPVPEGQLYNSIFVAMTEKGKGDLELATKLASLRSTRYGQEIEILKELGKNNPVKDMITLSNRKIEIFGGKEKVKAYVEKTIGGAKKVIKSNYLKTTDWASFIESIKC